MRREVMHKKRDTDRLTAKLTNGLHWICQRFVLYLPQYRFIGPVKLKPISPPPEGAEFRRITFENVELIREWKGFLYVRRFRALLNRGYVGLYGMTGGKVVSFGWAVVRLSRWTPGCWHDLLEVGQAMEGRLEVHPDYRRQHFGFHTLIKLREHLGQIYGEHLQIWHGVLVDNTAMLRLSPELGNVLTQEDRRLYILGHLHFHWVWNLVSGTTERIGRGRLVVRFKVPDFFFSPGFKWLRLRPS